VLSGHSATLDPRVDAVRDDLADVELADRVFAPHYARALAATVTMTATVHIAADVTSLPVDHLTPGTAVDVFDFSGGWAWVRTGKGMGYVRAESIATS
jgi:hypothetical protein